MTTERSEHIRRRENGSIDTEHYLARGRLARSRQAYHLLGLLGVLLVRRLRRPAEGRAKKPPLAAAPLLLSRPRPQPTYSFGPLGAHGGAFAQYGLTEIPLHRR